MNIAKQVTKTATIAGLMILTALPVLAQASVKEVQYRNSGGYTYSRTTVTPYGTRTYTRHYSHHRYRHYHRAYPQGMYSTPYGTTRSYHNRYYSNGTWRSY